MAKRTKTETARVDEGALFIDKTGASWYCKADSNEIMFCSSIDDIINGKAERYGFVNREVSIKREQNGDKVSEHKKYVLFTLADNSKILVRVRGELK